MSVMKSGSFGLPGVALLVVLSLPCIGYADSFWGDDEFLSFCKSLRVPERDLLKSGLGAYLPVIENREKLDSTKIVLADFAHIAPLLLKAIKLRWGALEFFTMREFADASNCLVMLDRRSLAEVNDAFDLHGLWMTRSTVSSKDNQDLAMDFVLLGHGKLIVGYPKEAWVRVPDYNIEARYTPYTSMRIEHREGLQALSQIKTLSRPDGDFESFEARALTFLGVGVPIGIRSLKIDGNSVLVGYRALWGDREELRPRIPIAERCGLSCAR
jgi:hypothetical protein